MSMDLQETPVDDTPAPVGRDPLRTALVCILAVAALLAAGTVGWIVRGSSSSSTVSSSSVDAGFARDMAVHHTQAVIMAGYVRDTTTDPAIKNLALDIELAQQSQIGEMYGWLDAWNLSRTNPNPLMSWMGGSDPMSGMDMSNADGALMPGMATTAEVSKLETMTGKAMDVYFLQLMLRHHLGGIPMANYAAVHATQAYVRNFAQKISENQTNEVTVMKQMLTERGAKPLS